MADIECCAKLRCDLELWSCNVTGIMGWSIGLWFGNRRENRVRVVLGTVLIQDVWKRGGDRLPYVSSYGIVVMDQNGAASQERNSSRRGPEGARQMK